MNRSTQIILLVLALATLSACESTVSRHLVIHAEPMPTSHEVEAVFDAFAIKHGFTCDTKGSSPLLKDCRARGPRFLRIEERESSFLVELDQLSPGPKWQAPKKYTEAAEELVRVFQARFGNSVEVTSKISPNNSAQSDALTRAAGFSR